MRDLSPISATTGDWRVRRGDTRRAWVSRWSPRTGRPLMYLVCGEALYDVFLDAEDASGDLRLEARPGGSPFNVAIGIARLGGRSALLTGMSRDMLGERLERTLKRESVSTDYLGPAGVLRCSWASTRRVSPTTSSTGWGRRIAASPRRICPERTLKRESVSTDYLIRSGRRTTLSLVGFDQAGQPAAATRERPSKRSTRAERTFRAATRYPRSTTDVSVAGSRRPESMREGLQAYDGRALRRTPGRSAAASLLADRWRTNGGAGR